MKKYIYFIFLIFIISCSSNKGVYWCGDHACANNKEKEAYFKKTMIVEVRNLDKNNKEPTSSNEKILNQTESGIKKKIDEEKELQQEVNLEEEEREIEKQIEIQEQTLKQQNEILEQEMVKEKEILKEETNTKKESLNTEKLEEKKLSTKDTVVETKEVKSRDFDELVENILARNSSRSYPKLNDIPK